MLAVDLAPRSEPKANAEHHPGPTPGSVAWALFPQSALEFVEGTPAVYVSSRGVERGFCDGCGTPLTYTAEFLPDLVDLTVASFDDPEALAPQMHIWDSRRLPWLPVADGLPRHAELPPQS